MKSVMSAFVTGYICGGLVALVIVSKHAKEQPIETPPLPPIAYGTGYETQEIVKATPYNEERILKLIREKK